MPPPINDLDLARWKDYAHLHTDSLWLIPSRDNSGAHQGDYHGNFVPQIPQQMLQRYTRAGEIVLDLFLGSGTTLIECLRLGRHGVGVDLQFEMVERVEKRLSEEAGWKDRQVVLRAVQGDSSNFTEIVPKLRDELCRHFSCSGVQLVLLHPPYHDIIRFSGDSEDLSNCTSVDEFLVLFGKVVDVAGALLDEGRYLVLVMGDMYAGGEWIPLGSYCMSEVMKRNFKLRSIVVKDMQNNRAKSNQNRLWRYRALKGGFFVFKHEQIFVFQKRKTTGKKRHGCNQVERLAQDTGAGQ